MKVVLGRLLVKSGVHPEVPGGVSALYCTPASLLAMLHWHSESAQSTSLDARQAAQLRLKRAFKNNNKKF